jgi:uroporphyrinogen-III synthase
VIGWRVLVTRPDAGELSSGLRERGAIPVAVPTIEIRDVAPDGPLDRAAREIADYEWVVGTSANGVRALFARLHALGVEFPENTRWAAVGPATAAALAARGARAVRVPEAGTGAAIAAELGELRGVRVLLARARIASDDLPAALVARGAIVEDVPAYETVIGPESSRASLTRALEEGLEAAIFTSGSTVAGFARLAADPRAALSGVAAVCIGPVTARALEEAGIEPARVAAGRSAQALIEAVEEVARDRA